MRIGFIGAGKVGTSLGTYFMEKGILISGYFSKSYESSNFAADSTKSAVFLLENDVIANSDIIFITTPDDEISEICKKIFPCESKEKVFVHCSGALSSNVFAECQGVSVSAHPLGAFSSKNTTLEGMNIVAEGDERGIQIVKRLFSQCGNKVLTIKKEDKIKYHGGAVIASNLVVALSYMSLSLFKECGFSEKEALLLMEPLMKNNVNKVYEKGPVEALTGPIERGDVKTLSKHLNVLKGEEKEIYKMLSKKLVQVAEEKNKNRNYSMVLKELEG